MKVERSKSDILTGHNLYEPESLASFFCCHGNVAFFTRTAMKNPPVSCWCGSTLMLKYRKSVVRNLYLKRVLILTKYHKTILSNLKLK